MMSNSMRQQGMSGPNPNTQMNVNQGGGMGMGGMGGMSRGFSMNEQGHMAHMGPMGGGSMYGGGGGAGGGGGGGMGNRVMQMNQMGHMNHPGQGMPPHPQQPPFQNSGGFGLSGMNSPSGSPRMGGPQQGLLMSPRNRGSPKMGANQFSPGGKCKRRLFNSPASPFDGYWRFFCCRYALTYGQYWWSRWWGHLHLLQQLSQRATSHQRGSGQLSFLHSHLPLTSPQTRQLSQHPLILLFITAQPAGQRWLQKSCWRLGTR